MAGFYNLDHKEVIRVKVKKCDGKMQPEFKKFSIDPQITSFEMLQGILAKAFEIISDFTISYLAVDSEGQAVYLSMLSDWDMDAAFQCAADPCLKLKVDLRPFEEELEDWDVIGPTEIPQHRITSLLDKNSLLGSITGTITHNLGKTMNTMQRAMGLKAGDDAIKPIKPPMSDMEFHRYLDNAGFMIKPNEFRLSIYQGGIESSLRRVAWRHLLNIFPANMSGRDRFDYMKRKEEEYRNLRDEWRERFRTNNVTEEVKYVAGMVKKDVLRTDRSHSFYAGNDENENTLSLFHILVTYALTHPDISYCQGMSDIASPLLVTQKDEGQAYICFCALMSRLRENFTLEGHAMMTKFEHLLELLSMYDPNLHAHLVENSAGDLFFCYRWLLLELKREFPFSDALYVLEVMWATLPPSPPIVELPLVDSDYSARLLSTSPCSPTFSFQQAMYAKLLAMRRVGAMNRGVHGNVVSNNLILPKASSHQRNGNVSNSGDMTTSGMSSFDTSPCDIDERGSDFPEVDNAMVRSLQRKSDSIDQVLLEPTPDRKEKEESLSKSKPEDDDIENFNSTVEEQSQSSDIPPHVGQSVSVITQCVEATTHPLSSETPEEELDLEQSVSGESHGRSWSQESSEQPTQFSMSLEVSNSEEKNANTPTAPPSYGKENGGKADTSSLKPSDSNSNSSTGLFQSMKRLLSSPKRRPNTVTSDQDNSQATVGGNSPQERSDSQNDAENLTESGQSGDFDSNSPKSGNINGQANSTTNDKRIIIRDPSKLPAPQKFGAGNPFLLFVCFTLITHHRETILRGGLCYEEIAMHFDRLVRRHNAQRMLFHARQMYTEYLKAQQSKMARENEEEKEMGFSC